MTQEDKKELLLKDLLYRLPYRVMVKSVGENKVLGLCDLKDINHLPLPYLRPMSSMTEVEKEEFEELFPSYSISIERVCVYHSKRGDFNLEVIDWLNKKMFAYRTIDGKDMFELGLALQAPEGMYGRS